MAIDLKVAAQAPDTEVVQILLDVLKSAREGRVSSVAVAYVEDGEPCYCYAAEDEPLQIAAIAAQVEAELREIVFGE